MKKSILALGLSLLTATTVSADNHEHSNFSYNNATVSYTSYDIDIFNEATTGVTGQLVSSIGSSFYAKLQYSMLSTDYMNTTIDVTMQDYGVGYHYSVNSNFDLNVEAAIVGTELKDNYVTVDDAGYRIGVIARYMVMPNVEAYAGVNQISWKDTDTSETTFNVGAKYNISENFDAILEIGSQEDASSWMLGGSYRW